MRFVSKRYCIRKRASNLNILSGKLIDVLKRSMYYGKGKETPSISQIRSLIGQVYVEVCVLSYEMGCKDVRKIMFNNLAKLKTRFPNKFSTEKVFNRDLEE